MEKKKTDKSSYKECKVLRYHKDTNLLLVDFDGYGICFKVEENNLDIVKVKYVGKIGTKNFKCELVR